MSVQSFKCHLLGPRGPPTLARLVRCHRSTRRQLSTSPSYRNGGSSFSPARSLSAHDAADKMMSEFGGRTVIRRQLLDANQLHKLAFTLGPATANMSSRPINLLSSECPPSEGTPIPPGWHLVYFTPDKHESKLGADGTDRSWNAPWPFTRRMWAGGRMTWHSNSDGGANAGEKNQPPALLRVGQKVEERTKLVSATAKKSRSAGEMVLVEVEKEFWSPEGLALTDRRSWVFRPELDPEAGPFNDTLEAADMMRREVDTRAVSQWVQDDQGLSWEGSWSPTALFRFSALTFNGHKIHYNEEWTTNVEGHPGLVVHGPLTLINMINYWTSRSSLNHEQGPRSCQYRALSPIYAGETHRVQCASSETTDMVSGSEVETIKNGVVCMKATFT